jgi:hypothetical protein
MGPKKTHAPKSSWLDKLDSEPDQSSSWLDLYRRHLSWIKSSVEEDDESMLNDLASEM